MRRCFSIFILIVCLSGVYAQKDKDNILIKDKLRIYSEVQINNNYRNYYKSGILSELFIVQKNYLENKYENILCDKIISGELDIYLLNSINDIQEYAVYNLQNFTNINYEDNLKNIIGSNDLDTNDINNIELLSLGFIEDWNFSNDIFYKEVKTVNPIFIKSDNTKHCIKNIHFINPEKGKAEKIAKKIKYEYFLYNSYVYDTYKNKGVYSDLDLELRYIDPKSPMWTGLGKLIFIKKILTLAFENCTYCSDFKTGKWLKNEQDFLKTLIYNYQQSDSIVINSKNLFDEINIFEYKSVIFFEEWYLDPKNMQIKKNIVGIAPVRWFYKENDYENFSKEINFVYWFDWKKQF